MLMDEFNIWDSDDIKWLKMLLALKNYLDEEGEESDE